MSNDDPRETLTHLDAAGSARMVDVSGKGATRRRAVAEGWLRCSPDAFARVTGDANPKGDVEQIVRIAGIMGGKRTGELIPLCHVIPEATVKVDVDADAELPGIRVRATATVEGSTGVEMEALTAVSVALLTAYDMLKAVDKGMTIGDIRLIEKSGGSSGSWVRD